MKIPEREGRDLYFVGREELVRGKWFGKDFVGVHADDGEAACAMAASKMPELRSAERLYAYRAETQGIFEPVPTYKDTGREPRT